MFKLNRRQLVASVPALLAFAGTAGAKSMKKADRPNILFIMADDLGFADLSITGSRHIKTPAIDSLGEQGILLRQGYSSSPVCSPTRTALLTGSYAQRFRIGLEEPLAAPSTDAIAIPAQQPTIASVLKALGYSTSLIGKWHLGDPPKHGPLRYGYDKFLGIVEGGADYFVHKMVLDRKPAGIGLAKGDDPYSANGYLTDIFGDEAVRQIQESDDAPFFMSLHFTAPHWPWQGRDDQEATQDLASSYHADGGNIHTYRKMMEALDENIAKVLAALEQSGKADNTIVVFTSDNGGERFSDTWPFVGHKGEVLEGGIRVPVLVRWPGRIAPGTRSDQVIISMDFLPTLLAMAGGNAAAAGTFDGMDVSAQLLGAQPVQRTLFWRFKGLEQAAVRHGDWKYLRLGGKEGLYDLSADEREQANRIKSPAQQERLDAMRKLWAEWDAKMLPYTAETFTYDTRSTYSDRF